MRILVVHNQYQIRGGEDEVVDSEIRLLKERGHDVRTFIKSNHEISDKTSWQRLKFVVFGMKFSSQVYDELVAMIKDFQPDIVHIHNTFYMLTSAVYLACSDMTVPVVQTLHNYRFLCPVGTFSRAGQTCTECLDHGLSRAIKHRCWKHSLPLSFSLVQTLKFFNTSHLPDAATHRFVVQSEFGRELFLKHTSWQTPMTVKPNFLEADPGFCSDKDNYIVFIGALIEYKGIKTLIKAWQKQDRKMSLKVIGSGPLADELDGQSPSIEFLGSLSFTEVLTHLKKARWLVLPTLCFESCPRVIIEAYACGVPVLASQIGTIPEWVDEGQTGALFAAGDEAALSDELTRIDRFEYDEKQLAQAARGMYEARFTAEQHYDQVMSIYKNLLPAQ